MAENSDKAVGLGNLTGLKSWALGTFPKAVDVKPVAGQIVLKAEWTGNGPFTQPVTIPGTTINSRIDVQPDEVVLEQLIVDGVTALWIANDNGVLTAYALGAAPTKALTVQYTRVEVIT